MVTATATEANLSYRPGDRHAIIVFLKGEPIEAVERDDLPEALAINGWRTHEVVRSGRLGYGGGDDEKVKQALEGAIVLAVASIPITVN